MSSVPRRSERLQVRVEARAGRALEHALEIGLHLCGVTPGFRRPITCSHQYVGCSSRGDSWRTCWRFNCESSASGSSMSGGSASGCWMPVNSGDRTPTIVTSDVVDADDPADDVRIAPEARVPVRGS